MPLINCGTFSMRKKDGGDGRSVNNLRNPCMVLPVAPFSCATATFATFWSRWLRGDKVVQLQQTIKPSHEDTGVRAWLMLSTAPAMQELASVVKSVKIGICAIAFFSMKSLFHCTFSHAHT